MIDFLSYDFMQRAMIAAVLVGLAAPLVGVFVVQRRLALIGDGMGHIALTGVAIGLVTSRSPVLVALVAAILGALFVEAVRLRGRTSGDLALAIIFYGGIAGGVVIISKAPGGSAATLTSYLFGAITTTTEADLVVFAVLATVIVLLTVGLWRQLFAVADDEEYARSVGLPVNRLNLVLAVLTATTVVMSMRIIGLLLISALMVIPVASAILLTRSFRATMAVSVLLGVGVSVLGVAGSYAWDTPSGGTIVLLAIGGFVVLAAVSAVSRARHRHVA